MYNKLLVGKLKEMTAIEISEKGKPKLLIIPKGIILDFQVSSDWPHEITNKSWEEIEDYIDKNQKMLEEFYSDEDEG